ncbi:MAG TPA: hypothetical protein VEB22_01305 [Phycisphaerales bacterium]|nr:hypothetical protein [Phycisphaerales bacterium]
MLILNPHRVELGPLVLERVTSVAIDRATVTPVEQWGSTGPWCRLVDSTKRRVTFTVRQEPGAPADAGPALGSQAEIRVSVSPAASDRHRRRVRCICVVVAVRYEQPAGKPPVRTISLLAISTAAPAGATDPVVIEEANP